ncbi:uncharacterized protein C8R40DRAFT_1093667, partial [Lentinula edodes]|uniref:uncharacterized protein n=1 Tax=Lentinula edodes TaxID=5353 RepID=UPI001E8CE048
MTIHSLPVEILEKIFHICFREAEKPLILPDPYGPLETSTQNHFHAAANAFPPPHVCTFWRNICSSSPKFNPTLSLHYRHGDDNKKLSVVSYSSRLCAFLRLTAPHPISISFQISTKDQYGGNYLHEWYSSEEMVLAIGGTSGLIHILEHHHRWKSATISIPYPIIPVFFPEDMVFPNLKKLDVHISSSSNDRPDEPGRKLFGPHCTPNLCVTTFQQDHAWDLTLRWRSSSLIQIIILYSVYIECDDLRAFKECNSLHTIHFSSCTMLPSFNDVPSVQPIILLPNVNTVSCTWTLPNCYIKFTPLSFLALPKLRNLQLQWNEGLELEVIKLFERSSFKLETLTLIQAQRGVYRPPTEQFVSLMTRFSEADLINQSLVGLELNHTDAKWDVNEFREIMEVLSLGERSPSSGSGDTQNAGGLNEISQIPHFDRFPFLKQLTIAAYTIPDHSAFTAMLKSRRRQSPPSSLISKGQHSSTLLQNSPRDSVGLEILRLRCSKSAFLEKQELLNHLETFSDEGLKLFYDPWVGVSRKNLTLWSHPSYEL